jgi:D-alanyl-D-alanine carboxypeptidase
MLIAVNIIAETNMNKQKTLAIITAVSIISAMPLSTTFAAGNKISAKAYIVTDVKSGNVIVGENTNLTRTPASLTKLVTAMVVMDMKVKLNKEMAITQYDQNLGECGKGGGCIKAKPGVKFSVDELFHAALLPSANNAASALARSTGLSAKQFAAKMNAKAKALGAKHSVFYEPTGMGTRNRVTAADYSKIVTAAFKYPYLKEVAQTKNFTLTASNNSAYDQTVKNNNKLLVDGKLDVVGGKNGYIGSLSGYNYGAIIKTKNGTELSVVVLGEPHMYTAYDDTSVLVKLAESVQNLALK